MRRCAACCGALAVTIAIGQPPAAGADADAVRAADNRSRYAIEVIVRTAENFHRREDVVRFVEQAAGNGVRTIHLLVKQDEDAGIPSGAVYYRSALAPGAAGYDRFDALRESIDAAHARGIKVYAWIPQFHDQIAARRHPAWQMMSMRAGQVRPYRGSKSPEYFVNPLHPEVQAYERSIIREIAEHYPIDGVMLDWIRFDNFDMDLGETTRRQFQALHGVDPLTLDFARPSARRDQWNDYRTDGLAAYVAAIRADLPKSMPLGVFILPPEFVEVGQDASKFNQHLQTVAPMCYFVDWGYPVEWFWKSCLTTTQAVAGRGEIIPAMDTQLTEDQYRRIFSHLRQDFASIRTVAWFHHGQWSERLLNQIARRSAF